MYVEVVFINHSFPIYNYQFGATKFMECIKYIHMTYTCTFVPRILIFQVTEQPQLVVASNADAEVTERAVPGETISPSNVQPPSMVVPSATDNASTLASLRMVSYVSFTFSPCTILFSTPLKPQSLPLSQGKVNKDSMKTKAFSHYMRLPILIKQYHNVVLQLVSNYKSFSIILSNIAFP